MADGKLFTFFFGRADDAFAPALPHPVVWKGANSQICHQMWQLYSHMACFSLRYDTSTQALPVKSFFLFCFLSFSFFLVHARAGKKKRSAPEEAATQAEKNGNSVLPIKTM